MTAPRSPTSPDSLPGAVPDAAPEAYPPDAGYAAGSARQTGHELLERPAVAERVRAIRAAWQTVEREEAQILLGRLEQAWDAAVEKGSAALMLRVVRLQAELSGLDRRNAHRRAGLWPLSGEETLSRPADAEPGPIAEAVRRGRHRTERALAVHRANRKALKRRKDFDEAAWLATAQRLHATVEERRSHSPVRTAGRPVPDMTNPDNSLHGSLPAPADGAGPEAPVPTEHDISLHGTADAPMPDSAGDSAGDSAPGATVPTKPDISLHRAGLLPAETAGGVSAGGASADGAPALDGRAWFADHHAEMARIRAEGRPFTDLEMLAYRTSVDRYAAKMRIRNARFPDGIQGIKHPGGAGFPQPAGEPGPEERRAEEKERAFLRRLARTRPPYVTGIAGAYLLAFTCDRPCRGAQEAARPDGEHDVS